MLGFGLALVVALVLAVGLGVAWLFATESGARFVLVRGVAATDGALEVGAVSGRFSEGLVLTDIRYRDPQRDVAIDRLMLRLGVTALVRGLLVVEELESSVVRYTSLEALPASAGGSVSLPALPLSIRVERATLAGIALEGADDPPVVERIVLAGSADGTTAYVQRLEARVAGYFVSIQGGLGWQEGVLVDGIVSWSGRFGDRPLLGSADVTGRWPLFSIEQELLEPLALTTTGNVLLGESPAFDLVVGVPELGSIAVAGGLDADGMAWRARVEASDLDPAGLVPAWPGLVSVEGILSASLEPAFRVASDDLELVASLGTETLTVDFAGAFEPPRLDIERLVAVLGANRAEISGSIAESLDLAMTADFADLSGIAALAGREEIRALAEPARFATSLTGSGTAELAVTGELAAPLVTGSVRVEGSSFAGLPLALTLDFATPTAANDSIRVDRLEASLGASRVAGSGSIGADVLGAPASWRASTAPVEIALEAGFDDLAELAVLAGREELGALIGRELPLAGLDGQAQATLRITGSPSRPDVAADVRASDVVYDRLRLTSATLDAALGLYPGSTARLGVSATAPDWSGELRADGRLADGAWSGTLQSLALDEPWLGAWSLEAPVGLVVGPGRVELDDACLVHADSALCGGLRYGGDADQLNLRAADFELAVLNPLLPPTLSLAGRVSLDAALDSPTSRPTGTLTARGGEIDISLAMSEADVVTTTLGSVSVDAALDGYGLDVEAGIASLASGHADLALHTDDLRNPDAAIGGRLSANWPDLAALALLSPAIGQVGGTLSVAIDVGGTAASPEVSGNATVDGGSVAIPEWGIRVDRIDATAQSAGGGSLGRSLDFSGSGFLEDQEIRISGMTELDPAAGWPTRINLNGENLLVANRPDAVVFASPDFDVDIRLPRIDVSGTVRVPEALISVEQIAGQGVPASPDSVVHGRVEGESIRPLEVTADVRVELGDSVRYTGSNLDVGLDGALAVSYASGLSPTASGSVSLAGRYDAYGQSLTLERGELLFAGPLDDPAVDVLAVREIGATTVGIRLTGTLRAPSPSLFSDPLMSDANALSYLMFGRPLSASDDEETASLQSAALALGLQQALPVVQRVGETLGLDELSIEMSEVDAGALMAGKYLSPRVYMSYTYGLFNRIGGFLLRYDINERFSIETRSGDEKSMDLLYSIEKE